MRDNTIAYLTFSKLYYVRHEPFPEIEYIRYYSLTGEYIPLAHAICDSCKEEMQSKMCGHFVRCKCSDSFVDTDRWMPERHRYGGKAKPTV